MNKERTTKIPVNIKRSFSRLVQGVLGFAPVHRVRSRAYFVQVASQTRRYNTVRHLLLFSRCKLPAGPALTPTRCADRA
ncbi:hypothetical protein EVAR_61287_1 [Eumeta japonica]|uniref:Uncharacterized protein n=1 Tax=Eumeta variegata TaxID=151549 RepID=A0A4C1XMN6_EUMVA|nr:hypothetical protein EVAR_61287_1 [Eumeta japonica]